MSVLPRISGREVASAFHKLGYEPARKDAHDVLRLCRVFNLPIPKAYSHFPSTGAA